MLLYWCVYPLYFFSSRRRHTRYWRDWSSDVCSSDLYEIYGPPGRIGEADYHLIDQGPAGWLLSGSAEFRAANAMTGAPMKIWFDASWDRKSMGLRRFFGEVTRGGRKEPFRY